MRFLPCLLVLAVAAACRTTPSAIEVACGTDLVLPAEDGGATGWQESSPLAFEKFVEVQLPEGRITPLPPTLLIECEAGLADDPRIAVRAAVILGRSRSPEAAEVILDRLDQRILGDARTADAGDAVAAAALAHFPHGGRHIDRLRRLAVGADPHPDLEVRVECACTALSLGCDAVVPFLLRVLRIGTWEGQKDERDFAVSDTTAWARGRAAWFLSRRAEVPVTYHVDASIRDREEEAARLRAALTRAGVPE